MGETLTYTFTLSNNTPFAASNVNFVAHLPQAVNFLQVSTSDGSECPSEDPLICNLGTLPGQGEVIITVEVSPDAVQPLLATASVTTSSNDSVPGNNQVTLNTQMIIENPASITIIKDAQPDGEASFGFTSGLGGFSLVDDGGPAEPGIDLAFNFQPAASAVPTGFTAETGAAYGDKPGAYDYGWLNNVTNAPIDATGAIRDRARASVPPELDTIIHMERGDCCTTGFVTEIKWEIALPNGQYTVELAAGDQGPYDSTHTITVEGIPVINGFVGSAGDEFDVQTATVNVTDGRLTVAPAGDNSKLAYIRISGAPAAGNQRIFDNLAPGTFSAVGTRLSVTVAEGADAVCTFTNATSAGNLAPTAINDSASTTQPDAVTFNITANDFDPDGTLDQGSVDLDPADPDPDATLNLPGIGLAVYNPSNGEVTFTPEASFSGLVTLPYTISDNNGQASNPATIAINVRPALACPILYRVNAGGSQVDDPTGNWVNQGPYVNTCGSNATTSSGVIIDLSGLRPGVPAGLFQNERWDNTPAPPMIWTFDANIDEGDEVVVNLFFAETYNGITGPGQRVFDINIEGALAFNDVDQWAQGGGLGKAIMLSYPATIDADGQLNISFGHVTENPAVKAIEVLEDCDPAGVPTPQNDSYNLNQGEAFSTAAPGVLANDTDPDGQALTAAETPLSAPLHGSLVLGADGSFTYTHDGGPALVDSFTYLAVDPDGNQAAATVTLNIMPVATNNPPQAQADSFTMTEGSALNIAAPGVLANDSDPEGGALLANPAPISGPNKGSLTLNEDGSFTYTYTGPALSAPDTDSFTYSVSDGGSAAAATVTITINPDPSAQPCAPFSPQPCGTIPVVIPAAGVCLPLDGNAGGLQGTGFTMVQPNSAPLASQPAGDAAAPTFVAGLLNVNQNGLTITSTRGIQFSQPSGTPNSTETNSQVNALGLGFDADGYTQPFTISTTLTDFDLAESAGNNAQQAGLWFGLDEDNYAKVVVSKQNGSQVRVHLLREDIDHATNAERLIELNTANLTWSTRDEITLTLLVDPAAGTLQGSYSINGGAQTPIVGTNGGTNGVSSLALDPAWLAGTSLPDGTSGVTFAGVFATHRRAAVDDPITPLFTQFCITPQQIQPNQAPTAAADAYSIDEDGVLTVDAAGGLLSNDTDPENDDLTAELVTDVTGGTLTLNPDGSFTYTPGANFTGQDSFTYRALDPDDAASAPATVTITVNAINDAPVVDLNGPTAGGIDYTSLVDFTEGDAGLATSDATVSFASDVDGEVASLTVTLTNLLDAGQEGISYALPGPQETAYSTDLPLSLISVSDVDAGPATQVTLSVESGSLSLNVLTGLSFTAGDGQDDALVTFSGSLADVNAALASLVFSPFKEIDTVLSVTADDLSGASDTGTVEIVVQAKQDDSDDDDEEDQEENPGGDGTTPTDPAPNGGGLFPIDLPGLTGGDEQNANSVGSTPAGIVIDVTVAPQSMQANAPGSATWTIYLRNDGAQPSDNLTATAQVPGDFSVTGAESTGQPVQVDGRSLVMLVGVLQPGDEVLFTVFTSYAGGLPEGSAALTTAQQAAQTACLTAVIPGAQDTACIEMVEALPANLPSTGGTPVTLLGQVMRFIWVPGLALAALGLGWAGTWLAHRRRTSFRRHW